MSAAAVIRRCPQFNLPFDNKENKGCNLMTCPSCGAKSCHLCPQEVNKVGGDLHVCPTVSCDGKCGHCHAFDDDWKENDKRARREAGLQAQKTAEMEDREAQVPRPQTSEIPHWLRLLASPAAALLLGIFITPKFLVLALVYFLTALRPLYACFLSTRNNNNKEDYPQRIRAQLDATLALHRSMTIQFFMLGTCLWLYEYSRVLCNPTNKEDESKMVDHRAFNMARRLVHWEHAVGSDIEPGLQALVWNHCRFVIHIANFYYAIFHFVVPAGIMARLIVFQKDPRFEHRVGFFIMLLLALLLFTFVPTMPPRLMGLYKEQYMSGDNRTQQIIPLSEHDSQILEPFWGTIDTMHQADTLYDKLHKEGGNPYAAMPSMHTGWALWSCLTWISTMDPNTTSAKSRRYQTCAAISHVVFMIFVIIVTGNHFWLDAAAGALCVLVGRFLAGKLINRLLFPPGKMVSLPYSSDNAPSGLVSTVVAAMLRVPVVLVHRRVMLGFLFSFLFGSFLLSKCKYKATVAIFKDQH